MKENQLKNRTVGGGGGGVCDNTEIALEIHIKQTEGVLIIQLSLRLSRLDKVICYSKFCDDCSPFHGF